MTQPPAALASPKAPAARAVTFDNNGATTEDTSNATTVADFLRERHIVAAAEDFVYPLPDVPLFDGVTIVYRAAVPVTIATATARTTVRSAAENVGELLAESNVSLAPGDEVRPSLDAPIPANGTIRIVRVLSWQRIEKRMVRRQTITRFDFSMVPGASRIIARGIDGIREDRVHFTQRDRGAVQRAVVASQVLRKTKPRIIAAGIDEYDALRGIEMRGLERSALLARRGIEMLATAYTAGCIGCSGITAIGRPAGHGIVAVDPSVIPLGTHLFIPGYGLAIAGDTGGAIHGNRIDLGFNSLRDALLFGRREVTVYTL